MPRYFLSTDADEDIQDIYLYSVDTWGKDRARSYVFGLFEAFETISRNPRMGRPRPDLGDEIRSLPHASHIVFFTEWQGEIAILRVLHGNRDVEEQFAARDPTQGIDPKR